MLAFAVLGSLALHLMVTLPLLIPGNLFAAKAPPPEPIPVEIVSLPPKPAEEAKAEPPAPPPPPPEQQKPEPPPKPVQLPPPTPPPPVTPQQIVVATRDVATPPQGDDKPNAAPEKPEPQTKPQPMPPPPKPQAKPEPPKPEPPKQTAAVGPAPEREITGAIALGKPAVKPRDQITDADHKMPPVVVRPQPPGRAGNSLMPSYPSAARANGLEGRVVLLVTLSVDGRPRRIDIARSSGFDQLDESAVRAVWLWRFYRTDNGPPVEATIEIPLDFRL